MTMRTSERSTTEERVSFLEGAYDHLPTKSDVFKVEKELSAQIAKSRSENAETRTELSDRITESRTELSDRIAKSQTENAKLRAEMQAGFAQQRAENAASEERLAKMIAESEARMTKTNSANQARTIGWVIGACVLAVAIVTAIIRIFG